MFGRIKIRVSDTVFSKYLRKLRSYICEKCGRFFPEGKGLQVSHYWGRKAESVRFDEENCDVLCIGDHQRFEENPSEYHEWKLNRLGKRKYDMLNVRAHTLGKRADKLATMSFKQKLKDLEK